MSDKELLKVCMGAILANTMLIMQNLDLTKASVEMLEQINIALDTSNKVLELMMRNGDGE